jgi:hypothetical protein
MNSLKEVNSTLGHTAYMYTDYLLWVYMESRSSHSSQSIVWKSVRNDVHESVWNHIDQLIIGLNYKQEIK